MRPVSSYYTSVSTQHSPCFMVAWLSVLPIPCVHPAWKSLYESIPLLTNSVSLSKTRSLYEYGVFCPTPQQGILLRSEREIMRDRSLCQGLNGCCHVNDLWGLGELIASTEINMLPRYG